MENIGNQNDNQVKEVFSETLMNEEEKLLENENGVTYYNYLQNLANLRTNERIYNKGKAHASLLMATLLAKTESSLRMYCTGLKPDILSDFKGSYWAVFQEFFRERLSNPNFGKNSINILVQENDYTRKAPFQCVKAAQEKYPNKINVRIITKKGRNEILRKLDFWNDNKWYNFISEKNNYNFSIYDNVAYRFEYSADLFKAIGCFQNNADSMCKALINCFDTIFKDDNFSEELVLPNN